METFQASFCNPLKKDIEQWGRIDKDRIIPTFEEIDWDEYFKLMSNEPERKYYYSPSLEIEKVSTKEGVCISQIENGNGYEFYIFYKRPKEIKVFFGLRKRLKLDYTTDKQGMTKQDAIDCLNALIKGDSEYLANKIGK